MSYTHYYPNSEIFHASTDVYMGTQLDVLLVGDNEKTLSFIWQILEAEVSRLHLLMSCFEEKGELYNINKQAHSRYIAVSTELWKIFQDCFYHNKLTQGYFDITLGNQEKIYLDKDNHTIQFLDLETKLDLGAYGKGYALSRIRSILLDNKIENALINFGNSSILALGKHPSGDYWPISLNDPYSGKLLKNFKLKDTSLTVSGNTPSHTQHILNPVTKEFIESRKIVAIQTFSPLEGEVISTSSMFLDTKDFELLRSFYDITNEYVGDL